MLGCARSLTHFPAGFVYVPGSTTDATTNDPAIVGRMPARRGSFSVPAKDSISLHFAVTVANTPGDYFNEAGGSAEEAYNVIATGPTAKITVTAAATPTPTAGESNAHSNGNIYADCYSYGDRNSHLYSNSYRHSHAHPDANAGGESNAHSYGNLYADCYRYGDRNSNLYSNPYRHSHVHPDANARRKSNAYSDSYGNRNSYLYSNPYGYRHVHPNPNTESPTPTPCYVYADSYIACPTATATATAFASCPEDPNASLTRAVDDTGAAHGSLPVYTTVQAAYNAAQNGDVIGMFSQTSENLTLGGAKTLTITQCTVAKVTAQSNSQPVWNITSTGALTIIGPDAVGGTVGWRLATNGHTIKSVRSTGAAQYGILVLGNSNSVSINSVSGSPVGIGSLATPTTCGPAAHFPGTLATASRSGPRPPGTPCASATFRATAVTGSRSTAPATP